MQSESTLLQELLKQHQEDEIETTRFIVAQIEAQHQKTKELLLGLNVLLNNKALPARQRRDVAGIARIVADSNIFQPLSHLIAQELTQKEHPDNWGIYLNTIKLISELCWENPHLIEDLMVTSESTIDYLLSLLQKVESTPCQDDSLIKVINFLHSVSLKEGVVRQKKMPQTLSNLIFNFFTDSKFYENQEQKKLNTFFSAIQKFYSNVKSIDKVVFSAMLKSLCCVYRQYQQLGKIDVDTLSEQQCKQLREKCKKTDRRLISIIKKVRMNVTLQINCFFFVAVLKIIWKLMLFQPIMFIDSPHDNKSLITQLQAIIEDTDQYATIHRSDNDQFDTAVPADWEQLKVLPQDQTMECSCDPAEAFKNGQIAPKGKNYLIYCKVKENLTHLTKEVHNQIDRIIAKIISLEKTSSTLMVEEDKEEDNKEVLEVQLHIYGTRLDRMLNWLMRMVDENQLIKTEWYRQILPKWPSILELFYSRGMQTHIKMVYALLPQLNNMTVQSNISHNRYLFQKLDQQSMRTHLHLKLTAVSTQNVKNIISDSIIRFGYYMSDHKDILKNILDDFLRPLLKMYQQRYIKKIQKKEVLSIDDIQWLRMIVKVLVQLFPTIQRQNREELVRLKLYNYCKLSKQDEDDDNIFAFCAQIIDILCRHDIMETEEMYDTLENRQKVVKTIFVKLINHKIKTFFGTITNYFQDLRKLATPRVIKINRDNQLQIQKEFMFQGHFAYCCCMVNCLKKACLGNRSNMLKEDVSGMLLIKLFDFRVDQGYQGEDSPLPKEIEQYRVQETQKFNGFLIKQCLSFYTWLMQHISNYIHKLPMIIKKITQRRYYQTVFEDNKTNRNQLIDLSVIINNSYYLHEGKYLNLGIKLRKGNDGISEDFELKNEVIKLGNVNVIMGEFMVDSSVEELVERRITSNFVQQNYITSLVDFSILYLNKYEAEVHFQEEANYLIQATLWFIQTYLGFKDRIQEAKKKEKKIKKQEKKNLEKISKKSAIKAKKIEDKQEMQKVKKTQKADNKNDKELEKMEQDERPKKRKKNKKKKKQKKQSSQPKTLQRNKSKTSLFNQEEQKSKSMKSDKQKNTVNPKKAKANLHKKIEEYLNMVLLAATKSKKPLLKVVTLQYILKFISVNSKQNYLSKPPFQNFQLSLSTYLPDLLKLQVSDSKTIGFHLLLCRLGLKQITEDHVKIDIETGIKRYFFDHEEKEINLAEFLRFLENNFKKPPSIPNLVQILYKQGENDIKKIPFTIDNLTGFVQTGRTKDCKVQLKKSLELNMIEVKQPATLRRKSSQNLQDDKKDKTIKLSGYIPEGDINVFVTELITHAVNCLLNELTRTFQHNQKREEEREVDPVHPLEPFNIKVIIYTLHFLLRESPTLAPWIAKFKCKKIILSSLKNLPSEIQQKMSKYIFSLLNKYNQKADTIAQLGFLQVLLRLSSPFLLNTISGFIFQLCLDSTPLVLNTKSGQKQKYVSFGSVVRQKVVSQFQFIIFGGSPWEHLYRKAAILNLMTVMLNNREMARLLIQSHFISKLHNEYSLVMKKYESEEILLQNRLKGIFLTKLYIPFWLEPLSLLQQLNIAFHHNKKLNKPQGKHLLDSLIMLSEESINNQLIPADVLKKSKFRNDWPFGSKKKIRRCPHHHAFEDEQSQSDSYARLNRSTSSLDDDDLSSQDQLSNITQELDSRLAEMQRMQEQSYLSFESGNQSQLLNDEWDYSNSHEISGMREEQDQLDGYPHDDDRIIEQEVLRQMRENNSLDDEDISQGEQFQDDDGFDDDDELDEELEDELNADLNPDDQQLQNDVDFDEDDDGQIRSSMSDYFSEDSRSQQEDMPARQSLIARHKQEQDFFDNVVDVISYEKVNVVPKISRIQITQVFNLRFFLQLLNYPQRLKELQQNKHTKSTSEIVEEKKVLEQKQLFNVFSEDKDINLSYFVEWNQIYRYDYFLKVIPVSQAQLSKIFTDEHQSILQRRRRHGIIHRDPIHIPGWQRINNFGRDDRPVSMAIRIVPSDRLVVQHSQESSPQSRPAADHLNQLSNSEDVAEENSHAESQLEMQEQEQQAEAARILGRAVHAEDNRMYSDEDLGNILRSLNMSITIAQFYQLAPQVQNDIIQNYYMIDQARSSLNNNNPPNSPIEQDQRMEVQRPLSQGRVIDNRVDLSPPLGGRQHPDMILRQRNQQLDRMEEELQQLQREMPQPVREQYRKMSQQHISRINKDLLQTLNKQGKNNSKFYELKDEEIQNCLRLLTILSEKEHLCLPYHLFQTMCMNTSNLEKVVSSLLCMLLTNFNQRLQFIQKQQHQEGKMAEQNQNESDKEKTKPQAIAIVKILHLLNHLTNNYSIAMQFLKINYNTVPSLSADLSQQQHQLSGLQIMVRLLPQMQKIKSQQSLKFIIQVLENITTHHFYKSINALVGQSSEKIDINQAIAINQNTAEQLSTLLQTDLPRQHLHAISRIIMRLCLNDDNIKLFIVFMKKLIRELSELSLIQIRKMVQLESFTGWESKDHLKIVGLMNIFYEMVSSFKTLPTDKQHHAQGLAQLRKIIQTNTLQQLCQTSSNYLFKSTNPHIQSAMGEILQCFFVLFEIAIATSPTSTQNAKKDEKEEKHNQIASLGKLIIQNKSSELKREEEIVLGQFNLSKLWRQSISHPVFKTYINNCIKKKLANSSQINVGRQMSISQIPIFKIAISTPHMLTFDNKHMIFKAQLKRLRKKAKYHMMHLHVGREQVFEDSFTQIMEAAPEALKGRIKIDIRGEQGEDAGGLTRQWFQMLSKKMFDANYALFIPGSTGNTYHPSPMSYANKEHLQFFKFIGRITGKALYDGYLLDAYFTPAFYKHILNLPITYLDMELQDYQYFKSLKWIIQNSPIEDYLELNFTHSFDNFGQIQTKELLPGGQHLLVTEENKYQYVQLASYAKMATSIQKQLEAFLAGFHDLIPHHLIKIFNEKELEIMISGRPTIDIQDLRRNTDLVNYLKHDQIIVWLFEVLEQFDMELRTAFLQFVTGSSRVPVQGFKELRGMNGAQKFNIHRQFQEERLPRAHTCFNQLDLPNYKTKDILIEKLMLAITEGKEGFHLI